MSITSSCFIEIEKIKIKKDNLQDRVIKDQRNPRFDVTSQSRKKARKTQQKGEKNCLTIKFHDYRLTTQEIHKYTKLQS